MTDQTGREYYYSPKRRKQVDSVKMGYDSNTREIFFQTEKNTFLKSPP